MAISPAQKTPAFSQAPVCGAQILPKSNTSCSCEIATSLSLLAMTALDCSDPSHHLFLAGNFSAWFAVSSALNFSRYPAVLKAQKGMIFPSG